MKQNHTTTPCTLNGDFEVGEWVLSLPNNAYGCLVGQITAIDKLGTPEHGTENEADDIHIDFFEVEYSYGRVLEIEDAFCTLYRDAKCFDDLPLDDVIMAPAMLIRLPGAEFDELDDILSSYEAAKAWVENTLAVFADN